LLGNVSQFGEMLGLGHKEPILGCLPFFHSFGATVTVLYPLIEGIPMVTYPTPLEVLKLANLIERYQIALFVSTPTFLRGFLRRVEPEQLRSLKLLVTGAEKLPQDLSDAFYEKFKVRILQGYGLTETSPVAAVNLPNPVRAAKGTAFNRAVARAAWANSRPAWQLALPVRILASAGRCTRRACSGSKE
jgi:acyl-[acyl-carrier-protein]-phospholipid O-acyltransferase/long-chain-fatty-acid--[acyl-carrier-protein] ligase